LDQSVYVVTLEYRILNVISVGVRWGLATVGIYVDGELIETCTEIVHPDPDNDNDDGVRLAA
jgi:hypothetical protein